MHPAYDLHTGVDALHAACITLVKFSVNEHVHSARIFKGVFFYTSCNDVIVTPLTRSRLSIWR